MHYDAVHMAPARRQPARTVVGTCSHIPLHVLTHTHGAGQWSSAAHIQPVWTGPPVEIKQAVHGPVAH